MLVMEEWPDSYFCTKKFGCASYFASGMTLTKSLAALDRSVAGREEAIRAFFCSVLIAIFQGLMVSKR
ncbi:hypothetical protein AYI87_00820 [Shewanella sp. KCT]|nr:hypothetical protein AYI87_00820 [Shewanella sp. KCT]